MRFLNISPISFTTFESDFVIGFKFTMQSKNFSLDHFSIFLESIMLLSAYPHLFKTEEIEKIAALNKIIKTPAGRLNS